MEHPNSCTSPCGCSPLTYRLKHSSPFGAEFFRSCERQQRRVYLLLFLRTKFPHTSGNIGSISVDAARASHSLSSQQRLFWRSRWIVGKLRVEQNSVDV